LTLNRDLNVLVLGKVDSGIRLTKQLLLVLWLVKVGPVVASVRIRSGGGRGGVATWPAVTATIGI
jgi:hypothetical protein